MTRATLPNRRPNETIATDWDGHAITVTVGFDPATGDPVEVFADVLKGGQMQAVLSDTCVLASIALQHGVPVEALGKSLARVPDMRGGEVPASPVGAVVAVLMGVGR